MPEAHLIAIATFGLGSTGVASIESIALMIVNENWIPFENSYDAALLDALTREPSKFSERSSLQLGVGPPSRQLGSARGRFRASGDVSRSA